MARLVRCEHHDLGCRRDLPRGWPSCGVSPLAVVRVCHEHVTSGILGVVVISAEERVHPFLGRFRERPGDDRGHRAVEHRRRPRMLGVGDLGDR